MRGSHRHECRARGRDGERGVDLHDAEGCLHTKTSCRQSAHQGAGMTDLPSTYPIVQARHLKKHFSVGGGRKLVAIDDLDLDLFPGKTVALVGESGSGKSTVARCLTRLIDPDDGQIYVHGKYLMPLSAYQMSDIYRHVQMVFQDPNASLNPRMTV